MNWKEKISIDPNTCNGKAHVKGTRVLVSVILDNLSEDMSIEDILKEYPSLKREDIYVALQYAAMLARDEFIPMLSNSGQESEI
ncbi:MAG: DUF433 domain-containing protein [Promethearchaeota archaeon]